MNNLKELYAYREMIKNLVRKELRSRYKGSVLGFLWTFVNPLLQLVIYSVVFQYIMRVQMDRYYLYMFVGLLPWIFFCASVQNGAVSIMGGADLLKKIYFPRLVLPIATVTSAFINMLFSMVILFGALLFSGVGFSWHLVYLPGLLILLYFLGLGFATFFSAINVYFRDLEHILGIVTMMMFYVTPIIYPISMVPEQFMKYYFWNPMVPMVMAFQDIFYYQRAPELNTLLIVAGYVVSLLFVGIFVFKKLHRNFAEEF